MSARILALAAALILLSCAGGYAPPVTAVTTFTYDIPLHKHQLFAKAAGALKELGYTLAIEDSEGGQIRTVLRASQFHQEECDCGTWYNKPFTGSLSSIIKVELVLVIQEQLIAFETKFSGEHLNSARNVDRKLECVSTGVYEKQIVDAIMAFKPESAVK